MDAFEIVETSPAKQRLSSFSLSPNLNNDDVPLSNSPLKLAQAGFECPKNQISDEVFCKYCGLTFSNWKGESPLAVHRTLRPHCPFLNPTQQTESSASRTHTNKSLLSSSFHQTLQLIKISSARRQLFNNNESHEDDTDMLMEQPFRPKHKLGFLMLFESHRLLTFTRQQILNPFSCEAATYAKCGFVFNSDSSQAMCVFCNLELDLIVGFSEIDIEMQHEKKFSCPFLRGYDVGNISRECECAIRDKVRNDNFCSSLNHIEPANKSVKIRCPQFENMDKRISTFDTWPMLLKDEFSVKDMAACGFIYTGFMDSVRCFCCGIDLRNWSRGADPFIQHSKASPNCWFMLKVKGEDFINVSQNVTLIVEADYTQHISKTEQDANSTSSSTCSTPSSSQVGSPTLDMAAIKAATCQYTIEQIADAVIKFFNSSWGQYPNEELLIGTLKAADENHKQICQQREEIINKESEIEAKDSVIKDTKTQLQATKTQLQTKDSQLQAKDRELANTRESLQHQVREELEQLIVEKDEIIEQNKEQLEQNKEQLEQNKEIIEQKDEMLEHQNVELYFKTREVEDLKRHIQSLRQELRRKEAASLARGAIVWDLPITSGNEEEFPVARCTVCLSNPSQIVFQPCGHLCCCDQCASKLFGKKCPICREKNVALDKVYVI